MKILNSRGLRAVILGAAAFGAAPALAADGAFQLSVGADYSTGKYGDVTDTQVWSIPIGLRYSNGPFMLRVSMPYVRLEGPGSLITAGDGGGGDDSGGGGRGRGRGRGGGSDGTSSGGVQPGGANRTDSGMGDVNVTAIYTIEVPGQDLYVDVSGKVKLPTASTAKRLGTGKTDVTAGLEVTKFLGDAYVYAGGRRRFAGSSVAFPVRDVWGAGAGVGVTIANGMTLGLDYDWQQSAYAGNKASSEITASASFRIAKNLRFSLYGGAGLNDNSSDASVGAQLSWRFSD